MSVLPRFSRLCQLLAVLLAFTACRSVPLSIDEAIAPPQVKRTQGFIADAFKLIASGSPESLSEGFRILDQRDDLSDYGEDLRFLSSWLYNNLYPALEQELPQVDPLPGSFFAPLVEDISRGVYPVVRMEEVSYLFFLLPPLSVYFGGSMDTLEIAYESLTVGNELNPEGVLPQFLLGYVEERRGNGDEAINWYISALQKTTRCYPAAIGLTRIYVDAGRYEEAELILNDLGDLITPTGEYLYLRGRSSQGLSRYSEAIQYFMSAIELDGEQPRYLLAAAKAEFRLKEYGASLSLVERAKRRGVDGAEAVLIEARILRALEQNFKAMDLLSGALEIYPDNLPIKDLYGQLLLATGRTLEGRNILEGDEDLPSDTARSILLMENAIDAGFWEEALSYYQQAGEIQNNNRILEAGVRIYTELGDPEAAVAILQRLKHENPQTPAYALDALEIALDAGMIQQAEQELDDLGAYNISPINLSRLRVYQSRMSADSSRQRQLLEEALFLNVRNPEALFGLVDYYFRQGDPGRGRIYLLQLERMPELSDAYQARLDNLKERMP